MEITTKNTHICTPQHIDTTGLTTEMRTDYHNSSLRR
jgi:hypothetical protein